MVKNVKEKLCKELDKEGYYRYIIERDNNRLRRLSKIKSILTRKKLKRVYLYLLHMLHLHELKYTEGIYVDGERYEIFTCEYCEYQCTANGKSWENIKYLAEWSLLLCSIVLLYLSPRELEPFLVPAFIVYFFLLLLAGFGKVVSSACGP